MHAILPIGSLILRGGQCLLSAFSSGPTPGQLHYRQVYCRTISVVTLQNGLVMTLAGNFLSRYAHQKQWKSQPRSSKWGAQPMKKPSWKMTKTLGVSMYFLQVMAFALRHLIAMKKPVFWQVTFFQSLQT
ncbi:hypothetical protein CJT59_09395 [Pseudomonas aeruginosa]|nr:hypothetical protein APA96_03485 [Pseudomonas aeruginosa]PBY35077.1 hypothetical protein CJT59_09395 [Pseudomonas aeruginosa]